MLEERLSKAYSQHNLGGYSLALSRQPPSPYPSIGHAASNAASGAENFYTGEPQQQSFAQPTTARGYAQHAPQAQYTNYDKRGSVSVPPNSTAQYPPQAMQRNDSYQKPFSSLPLQYPSQPNFVTPEHAPAPAQAAQLPQPSPQTPHNRITESSATPSTDANAAYYFNNTPLPADGRTPTAPLENAPSSYPNLHQPSNFNQQSIPPTPASSHVQPMQPPGPPPQPRQPSQQYQQATQPNSQHYWQPQQSAGQPVHGYQANAPGYAGFNQDPFPSAPQHAPRHPVVEESLIDL